MYDKDDTSTTVRIHTLLELANELVCELGVQECYYMFYKDYNKLIDHMRNDSYANERPMFKSEEAYIEYTEKCDDMREGYIYTMNAYRGIVNVDTEDGFEFEIYLDDLVLGGEANLEFVSKYLPCTHKAPRIIVKELNNAMAEQGIKATCTSVDVMDDYTTSYLRHVVFEFKSSDEHATRKLLSLAVKYDEKSNERTDQIYEIYGL